ncbi:Piso0_004438 [Millerozyma farinosa CBS 7064]|uniref:Piso0_004438 protein n=1 Tax=Pichia sorbitophila (strain ATCC MYA-4447 / BCRC 22081 / CBS 7064 / NBRC 10061 / NRRL Y-12695) TaxID=559304 RepID=G8Y8T4_PICSO|nr:Piso0_004438 [Millerozyma farinosa CBS 7064]CCE84879.1 Piso0_004438 [Millerozyma farinosa CBS 7064]
MESNRIKKANRKNTSHLKSKIERSNRNSGILSNKIEQSIARANYIQKYRKADWEKINKEINSGAVMNEDDDSLQTKKQIEREEEDEYVKQFFDEDNDKKDEGDESQDTGSNDYSAQGNKFAILDEIEA